MNDDDSVKIAFPLPRREGIQGRGITIMSQKEIVKEEDKAPYISPYVFTVLLAAFGLWCFYDGWLNASMEEHALLNRIVSGVLLPWAGIDFWKVWKYRKSQRTEVGGRKSDDR